MGDVSYVVGENLPRRACCFFRMDEERANRLDSWATEAG